MSGGVFRVYKRYLRGIDGVQYLVLGGALSKTAIFRHVGGCIRGIEVYKGYIRGVDGARCVVLAGALNKTAIVRHLEGCIWGIQRVS